MSEIIELGVRQWENVSDDELGLTSPGLKFERTRHPNNKGQQFTILDIDARNGKPGPVILVSASFDFRDQPLSEAQMKILAVHSRARVMWSEVPGITIDLDDPMHTRGDFQTLPQTVLAFSGNFDLLAAEQLKAFYEVGELENEEDIQLVGKSLGAYEAVAMARVNAQGKLFKHALNITRIDLQEPVNAHGNYKIDRQVKLLLDLAKIEDRRRELYLDDNTRIGHEMKAFEKYNDATKDQDKYVKRRQILATYATGAGLRKGLDRAAIDALEASPDLRGALFSLSHAGQSFVSFDKDIESAAHVIRENGGRAETFTYFGEKNDPNPMAISHHFQDRLSWQASLAVDRKQRIDAAKH
jgi:hypothetical protein